jgi:hypothetical protein
MRRGLARSAGWRAAVSWSATLNVRGRKGMGLTAWKGELGIGTEALDGRGVRPRFDARERDALRELISNAVRERAVLDAKVWKEIKENGRPAAPQ